VKVTAWPYWLGLREDEIVVVDEAACAGDAATTISVVDVKATTMPDDIMSRTLAMHLSPRGLADFGISPRQSLPSVSRKYLARSRSSAIDDDLKESAESDLTGVKLGDFLRFGRTVRSTSPQN
jgi:hypothetical protein